MGKEQKQVRKGRKMNRAERMTTQKKRPGNRLTDAQTQRAGGLGER